MPCSQFPAQQPKRHGSVPPRAALSKRSPDRHLQSLCSSGLLDLAFEALSGVHTCISDTSYLCLLKACIKCRLPSHAKQVHAHIARHRAPVPFAGFVGAYLVIALARCGAVEDAFQISHALPRRSVFTWTAIMSAYVEHEAWDQALLVYCQMCAEGIEPDRHTFVGLFKLCGESSNLALGKKLHTHAEKTGIALVSFVGNSIVSMYGKSGAILEAEHVFTSLLEPELVSWNAILSLFVDHGFGEQALLSYRQMQMHTMGQNVVTFVVALQACATIAEDNALPCQNENSKEVALDIGQALHADAGRSGCSKDVIVGTTLLSMYKKCRALEKVENVFTSMRDHSPVSWTAMISAYVEHGDGEKALHLYRQMLVEDLTPNLFTFTVALQACIVLAEKCHETKGLSMKAIAFKLGRGLHLDAFRSDFLEVPSISSTLLTLYSKCGSLDNAEDLFNNVHAKGLLLWTAMVAAYIEQEQTVKALQLFKLSKRELMFMDVVLLRYVLQACGKEGSPTVCEQLHFDIICAGHEHLPSVGACLINAYGGCAGTADLCSVFQGVKKPNIVVWNSCCDGFNGDKNDLRSLQMFERLKLAGIEPDEVTFSVVLSSCRQVGNVSLGLELFASIMLDCSMHPDFRHYAIMVDLYTRTGNFEDIAEALQQMPVKADYAIWFGLLSASRVHGHVELAEHAFDQAITLDPSSVSPYIVLGNVHADMRLHERAAEGTKL